MTDLRKLKPKKNAQQLVELLRDEKGVAFSIVDENAAIEYLSRRNNYLRTASYRKNYQKYLKTEKVGKYINLEFAYLAELSTLDFYLRSILLKMCIDIEHALKVYLVDVVSQTDAEDGYTIIDDFVSQNPRVLTSIANKAEGIFTKDLIDKYFDLCYVAENDDIRPEVLRSNCPIWVFMEIIDFGVLTRFYGFCVDRGILSTTIPLNILNPVRSLRNACAHNNCLLNSLGATNNTNPPEAISTFVAGIDGVPQVGRKKKLTCRPIFEIVCLLYTFKRFVSPLVYERRLEELKTFVNGRMMKHVDYFKGNLLVSSSLEFLQKVIDNLK